MKGITFSIILRFELDSPAFIINMLLIQVNCRKFKVWTSNANKEKLYASVNAEKSKVNQILIETKLI